MCVVFIFSFVFNVIVGLYIVIYLHCQVPPSTFCRGRYKNSGDWLIDWIISIRQQLQLLKPVHSYNTLRSKTELHQPNCTHVNSFCQSCIRTWFRDGLHSKTLERLFLQKNTYTYIQRQTDRQRDRQMDRQTDRQQTDRRTERHTVIQTDRQTDRICRTDRQWQTDVQTDKG